MKLVSQRQSSHHQDTRVDDVLACVAVRVVENEGEALRMCRGARPPGAVAAQEELRELVEITQTIRGQAILLLSSRQGSTTSAHDALPKHALKNCIVSRMPLQMEARRSSGAQILNIVRTALTPSRYERNLIVEATSSLSSNTAYTIEKLIGTRSNLIPPNIDPIPCLHSHCWGRRSQLSFECGSVRSGMTPLERSYLR
ncbi:hypothetical protein DXG01_003266 [Tephrocybe rancida]|nr:hypothetical protein DXG01_003266 [Tephrocybe rancida]